MVFGNAGPQNIFKNWVKHDPKSILLAGPKSVGKHLFAKEYLNTIDPNLCFYVDLKIQSVRDSIEFSSYLANSRRFILIDDIELLTQAAQDSLLKTLEENIDSTFLLISHNQDLLNPALFSRFDAKIGFNLLSENEMLEFIKSIGEVDEFSKSVSRGRPGIYKIMHKRKEFEELFNSVNQFLSFEYIGKIPSLFLNWKNLSEIEKDACAYVCISADFKKNINDSNKKLLSRILMFSSFLLKNPKLNAELAWMNMLSESYCNV